jgi:predicted kinase
LNSVAADMAKPFVIVSGLPASGKSTLGRQLARALALPLLDKDEILERLFDAKGVGNTEWRRALSRESDLVLQTEASASSGAVLVSHWRLPGMPADSGTPTAWIAQLSDKVVTVHCQCPVELCAERFTQRKRHHGHLDGQRSSEDILARIRTVANFATLNIGCRLDVDTSHSLAFATLIHEVRRLLEESTCGE